MGNTGISEETPMENQCSGKLRSDLTTDLTSDLTSDIKAPEVPEAGFAAHMYQFIGETVTVFVKGGGASGLSFTGTLADVNYACIQLIAGIGTLPSCGLANACGYMSCRSNTGNFIPYSCYRNNRTVMVNTFGSIICIRVDKIVSFVHSSV